MIKVKIGRLNSEAKEYNMDDNRSIKKLLSLAGLKQKDTEVVTVNGDEIDADDVEEFELEDGDNVVLVRNVTGNTISL